MTDSDINHLCPQLKTICREWEMECTAVRLNVKVIETWRSPVNQDEDYAAGKSNAQSGESPHNCRMPDGSPGSRAFDFAIFDKRKYITDGTDDRYRQAADIGKKLGLAWGGDWHQPDWDHLELHNWKQL